MRLGQTSAIHFGSQLLASAVGFVATLYIAQELGSGILGTYSLFVGVLIWLKTFVGSGIQEAVKKRVSEVDGGGRDLGAGIVVQSALFAVVAVLLFSFRHQMNAYLGFEGGARALTIALGTVLLFTTVNAALHGEHKVHLAALLRPLDRIVRSGIQLAVVFLGVLGGSVAGLIWGYIAGATVAALAGVALVAVYPKKPKKRNFRRVVRFSKYSWLSGAEERSFSSMDTVVLGLFVGPSLLGYYEVAWNLASILAIFGMSISQSLFPAISEISSGETDDVIGGLITDGLSYAGLFLIPGTVGVLFIGDAVLGIYGAEFRQARTVLVVLVVARLLYAYESQFISSLNALDYPAIAFRVNLIFVASNIGLNLVLVWQYGWIGAAVGTGFAALVGLVLAYRALSNVIAFEFPVGEISRQFVAAGLMGGVVYAIEPIIVSGAFASVPETVLIVALGAAVYFAVLVVVSAQFRTVIRDNLSVL